MNPLAHKDILALLRLKRIAAIQLVFVALLAVVLLVAWPQGGMLSLSARSNDDLLLGIMLAQLVILILTVPGVGAASITAEREANTLEMLYASRLSALQIVLGKLTSALAFPVLLLLSGLPFVGLLVFRGATDIGILLQSYLLLIVAAVLLSVLSLAISTYCRQTSTALVMAYLVVLGLCGGVLVPAAILIDSLGGLAATALHWVRGVSPLAAMISLLRPQMPGDFNGSGKDNWPSQQIFLVTSIAIIAVCLMLLVLRLRQPPAEADRSRESARPRRRKPMASGNPVLSKERRTSSLRSGTGLIRIFYGMLTLSLLLSLMSLSGGMEHPDLLRYVFQILVTFQMIGIAAVTPSLTTPAISNEIEAGTFEMLRQTRLSGGKIFWGKFVPAYIAALLPVVAVLPAYGTLCFVSPAYVQYTLAVLPIVVLAMTFCCVLGMVCSVFTSSTARATVVASILVAAIFTIPALAWWSANAGLLDNLRLVQWLSLPSPLVMALSVVPAMADNAGSSVGDGFVVNSMVIYHQYLMGGICLVLLVAARLRLAVLLRRG